MEISQGSATLKDRSPPLISREIIKRETTNCGHTSRRPPQLPLVRSSPCRQSNVAKSGSLKETRDELSPCVLSISFVVVVVRSGLTSLSTIFQSYHDGVWLRDGAQGSLYIAASLK